MALRDSGKSAINMKPVLFVSALPGKNRVTNHSSETQRPEPEARA